MASVRLRWPRSTIEGLRSYQIERRTQLTGAFAELEVIPAPVGDTVVYFDTSVEPDQIYGYRVKALGNAGVSGDYSVIAGVRTPPRPGIDVSVVTNAPAATVADADGYIVRLEGPTPVSGTIGLGDATTPFVRRFSPLEPGDYTVVLSGVASNCRVPKPDDPLTADDTTRATVVTDRGLHTVADVSFVVDCRDPNRGTIEASITVTGIATNGKTFELLTGGIADDATLPETERVYAQSRQVAENGGTALFDALRPGAYEVELREVGEGCTLSGEAKRTVTLAALDIVRLEFLVECGGSGGGDVDDPARPFKLQNTWSNESPPPGAAVALDVKLFLTDTPPFVVGSVDATTGFSSTVLRYDSAVGMSPFAVVANAGTSGAVAWNVFTGNPTPATGSIPLARLWFTVIGEPGATTRTATTVSVIADEAGNDGDGTVTYASKTQPFPEARLTVAGGGGGGENQAPTAVIAGSEPTSGAVGAAVTFSADGSTDADGTIASYAWSFPQGNPASGSGTQASTTYTIAGTYTVTLTATDDDGAPATATRTVVVTSAGGGGTNQPPVAAIAGGNPLQATVGVPLTLDAAGSSDPEGGPLTYAWSMAGGAPSSGTGQSVTTTYAAAGPQTVTLTVTDNQGASSAANRTVTVSPAQPPQPPVVWKNTFGPTAADGRVAMSITLDLRTDLAETPGPEQMQAFRADSIKWDPAILGWDSTRFASNLSGTTDIDPARPGKLRLNGNAVGDGPTGLVNVATVYFTRKAGASGSTTTVTALGRVAGSPATLLFNYLPQTTISEGTYSASGGGGPSTGTVTGTLTRAGSGTQSLAGVSVTVDPTASGAPTATGTVSGSGASATFSLAVQVGTGSGAGAGSVTLGSLPSGCTVTTPAGGAASYSGLTAGGTQGVAFTVTCTGSTPGPSNKYVYKSAWGTPSGSTVDLVITFDPSGFNNAAPEFNGAGPDAVGGAQATTTLTGTNVARLTAVSAVATPSFGIATVSAALPAVTWVGNTTVADGFTTVQEVARLRYTIGGSGAATIGTSTSTEAGKLVVSTPDGDEYSLTFSGSGQNIEIIEAGAPGNPALVLP